MVERGMWWKKVGGPDVVVEKWRGEYEIRWGSDMVEVR